MRMMTAAIAAATALCVGAGATSVMAQDQAAPEPVSVPRHQYISVYGGSAGGFDYDIGTTGVGGAKIESQYADSAYFGVAYGMVRPDNLRLEMGLSVRKHDLDKTVLKTGGNTYTDDSPSGDARVVTMEINAYRDLSLAGGLKAYVGGGVGVAGIVIEEPIIEGNTSTFTLLGAAGLSYDVGDKAVVFVEGRYQYLGDVEIETDSGYDLDDNKINLSGSSVMAGIRFKY